MSWEKRAFESLRSGILVIAVIGCILLVMRGSLVRWPDSNTTRIPETKPWPEVTFPYVVRCRTCGQEFESTSPDDPPDCPNCPLEDTE
jgi:hypothetical protein